MDQFLSAATDSNVFGDEEKENIKNTFLAEFYKNKNMEDLVFLGTTGEFNSIGVFKYADEFLCYDIEQEKWYSLYYETLNYNNKNDCNLVKLIKKSSKNIEFILHPFLDKDESDNLILEPNHIVDMNGSSELIVEKTIDDCCNSNAVIGWKDGLAIHINSGDNTYIVKKDNKFVAGFIDEEANFQLGDNYTNAYMLNNGDIMIYNYGDVCSAVIIKVV